MFPGQSATFGAEVKNIQGPLVLTLVIGLSFAGLTTPSESI